VLDALRGADQPLLARDAEQLLALTETMDSAAFAPLRPGDLDARTARQVDQLHRIIDAVRRRIVAESAVAEPYGRSSHGRIFYGWYMRRRKTKKAPWYGFLPRAWAGHGLSPLWRMSRLPPPGADSVCCTHSAGYTRWAKLVCLRMARKDS